jgi:hypothetical protein
MARIAAVLTLTANPNAVEIPLSDMAAAAQLMDFYLQEALRLNSVAETDLTLTRAKALLDWLRDNNHKRVSMAQLTRHAPRATKAKGNVKAMRRLVATLADHYWLYPLPDGVQIDGKLVREAWEVVSV